MSDQYEMDFGEDDEFEDESGEEIAQPVRTEDSRYLLITLLSDSLDYMEENPGAMITIDFDYARLRSLYADLHFAYSVHPHGLVCPDPAELN
jgi:hypothetical protein